MACGVTAGRRESRSRARAGSLRMPWRGVDDDEVVEVEEMARAARRRRAWQGRGHPSGPSLELVAWGCCP
jgi:hypothetical protein